MRVSVDLRGGSHASVDECTVGSWEGGNVWPPAFKLVALLNELEPEMLATSSILECGAGCGLVGIAAALLGAHVVLSDLPQAIPTLSANAAINGLTTGSGDGGRIEVAVLDWFASNQPLLDAGRKFDIIVASECLYDADMVVPLLCTAHRACGPGGYLLLSGIIGGETVRLFRRHVLRFFGECVVLPIPTAGEADEPPPISRAIHRIGAPRATVLPDSTEGASILCGAKLQNLPACTHLSACSRSPLTVLRRSTAPPPTQDRSAQPVNSMAAQPTDPCQAETARSGNADCIAIHNGTVDRDDMADLLFAAVDEATAAALRISCDDSQLDSRGTVDAAADTVSVTYSDVRAVVRQQPTMADTAAKVWVDAVALARYLASLGLPAGGLGTTIDLGCGTGVLGLWVAKAGLASHVLLADRRSQAGFLRGNVALNNLSSCEDANGGAGQPEVRGCGCSVRSLEYGDTDAASRLCGMVDTCLTAALVYDEALQTPLIATLMALQPPRLVVCNSMWNPEAMRTFITKLSVGFDCTLAQTTEADHGLGGGGYGLEVWECRPAH